MNKVIQWFLNISAAIFFFLFFLFVFFPFEDVARHYISQIEVLTKGQYRVVVGEIKPSLIFKSSVKNLEVYTKNSDGSDALIVKLPELKVGLSYLPIITGTIKASIVATAQKGLIEGSLSIGRTEQYYDLKLKDFSLDNIPYLASLAKLSLKGQVTGLINVDFDPKDFIKSEGKVDLKLAQLLIPQSHLSPMSGIDIDLPETLLAETNPAILKFALKNGKFDLQDISFSGPDLILSIKGNIQLNKRINFSKLNLNGTMNFSDKIKQALPYLVMIDNQKNEQGVYPLTIAGRLTKPQVQIGTFDLTSLTGDVPPPTNDKPQ